MQIGWESGLYLYWVINNMPKYDKCLIEHYLNSPPKVKQLSWSNLSSPFALLLLGLSASLFVFLLELIWHRFKTHRQICNSPSKPKEKATVKDETELEMQELD